MPERGRERSGAVADGTRDDQPRADRPARKEAGVTTAQPATPDATDKPSGPRSRKGVETRARLVTAAKEVFERDGFLDARISDIAEKAGLSHGSFYHYFESKEEVFREVAAEVDDRLSEPMASIILAPSAARPAERIRAAIRQHMQSYKDEARIMGVIEQVVRFDPEVARLRAERQRVHHDEVVESIRRLQQRGLADPRLDADVAAACLGSMTYRFPEMWFVQGQIDCDFEKGVEQLALLFVKSLGLEDVPEARVEQAAEAQAAAG
jgi:AcrR family transcriptional regulator